MPRPEVRSINTPGQSIGTPPNLRETTILIAGDVPKSCSNCIHFNDNYCVLYYRVVAPTQVCDSWSV